MKKWIVYLLAVVCLLTLAAPMAQAAEGETSGTCGDGLTWTLEGGTLTVSGSGEMDAGSPWESHKSEIKSVVLTGGVTKVGEGAFADCENLTSINFGSSLKEIDPKGFYNCDSLTSIQSPPSPET